MDLSPEQQKIADHTDGPLLVKAGPGCGKMRALTERVKHLLLDAKRGKILFLTASKTAAEAMRSRLWGGSEAGGSAERVKIGTVHSFGRELIQMRSHLIGLPPRLIFLENERDRIYILLPVISDDPEFKTVLSRSKNPEALLLKYLSNISEQKRSLIPPEISEIKEPSAAVYQKYNEMLLCQNAVDFDDILIYAYRILAENKDAAKLYNAVYRYICLDEAQELNEAQYRVIQALCGSDFRNIMLAGDENQAIYAFNGSSSRYMSEHFVKDFSPAVYTLSENFCSAESPAAKEKAAGMSRREPSGDIRPETEG
jgi:DNA helicase-2/ATP-dependent DNA helicase PcrA